MTSGQAERRNEVPEEAPPDTATVDGDADWLAEDLPRHLRSVASMLRGALLAESTDADVATVEPGDEVASSPS